MARLSGGSSSVGVLVLVGCWLVTRQVLPCDAAAAAYKAWDDVSWAVWDVKLSNLLSEDKQALYDNHIQGCRRAAGDDEDRADAHCYVDEYHRMQLNMYQPRSLYNYTEMGFKKMRVPDELFQALQTFWETNRHEEGEDEWHGQISPYHNHWEVPTSFIRIQDPMFAGGGPELAASVSDMVREVLEEWTGQFLSGSSVYGIRVYHNNSILAPHCDRLPLITSAIINVDQDVDEPWPLEVYDHNGVVHNITMEPGDMVLYESHSVIHGRPFPMRGNYFANVFVHFEVLGDLSSTELPKSGDLPPYLMPGSSWEPEYWKDFPNGWNALDDIEGIVSRGDLRTLQFVVERRPEAAHKALDQHNGWSPIHEAVRSRHLNIVEYLLDDADVDVNTPIYVPFPVSALDLAYANPTEANLPIVQFLLSRGAEQSVVAKKVRSAR